MEENPKREITSRTYWLVLSLGIVYIILMGLFTFIFNSPVF